MNVLPICVVVPPRVLLLDLAGPVEVLRKANLLQSELRFEVSFVGPRRKVGSSIGLGIDGVMPLPARIAPGTMLVVPGSADEPMGGRRLSPDDDAESEQAVVDWLARVVRPGIRVMSICSGAMLVGRAGLLDGFECTTHHANTAELAAAVPAAKVRENRLYVEDGERLSSAGITSGIDLMLHMVAQTVGPAIAVAVARYLVVYLRRAGADPQLSPWLEGRNHMHAAIHRAQDAVAANPSREWPVDALARVAATSPRHLSRLFNEHAGMSVSEYVGRMRLALARELLAESSLDIEAVAERAGFGSSRQLRRAWARNYPGPPSRFRNDIAG